MSAVLDSDRPVSGRHAGPLWVGEPALGAGCLDSEMLRGPFPLRLVASLRVECFDLHARGRDMTFEDGQ